MNADHQLATAVLPCGPEEFRHALASSEARAAQEAITNGAMFALGGERSEVLDSVTAAVRATGRSQDHVFVTAALLATVADLVDLIDGICDLTERMARRSAQPCKCEAPEPTPQA